MELARHKPGMMGHLANLAEPSFLKRPGHDQPGLDECGPIVIVDLVAMTVTLMHDGLPIGLVGARAFADFDRLRTESHRPAEVLDLLLLGKQIDHGMRRLRIHLGRVGPFETEHVPRELGDGHVHAETNAEVRDLTLARDTAGEDLPLPAAGAEAAGDDQASTCSSSWVASSTDIPSASTQRT